ncbi:MAG: ABC transporter permease, partial [Bacteroidota bacterium]
MILLLQYELSFDSFHSKQDSILKVGSHDLKSGEFQSHSPMPLSLTLKNDFPEVKHVVGVWQIIREESKITINNNDYSGFKGASVEPDFFSIFDYKLIQGSHDNLLRNPNEIYISENLARKVFGKEDPVGNKITLQQFDFSIAGIFADVPENSEVSFDVLLSDKIREIVWSDFPIAWWSGGMHTYVILNENVSV